MRRGVVHPTSAAGWVLLVAFIAVIAAGIWPVIGWVNHAALLFGLPLLVLWSYLIIIACVLLMLVANHFVERDADE